MNNTQNNNEDFYYLLCDKNLPTEDKGYLTFSNVVKCLDFIKNKFEIDVNALNINIFDNNNDCRFYIKIITKQDYSNRFEKAMQEMVDITRKCYEDDE